MRIDGNKIIFPTHIVVCDPDCADAEYMQLIVEELESAREHTPREHGRILRKINNDGTWGIKKAVDTAS